MIDKLITAVSVALIVAFASVPSKAAEEWPAVEEVKYDTLVCPEIEQMELFVHEGFYIGHDTCSVIIWNDHVSYSAVVKTLPAEYLAAFENGKSDRYLPRAEIFLVRIGPWKLYAIQNPIIDEHWLFPQDYGMSIHADLIPDFPYEIWEDAGSRIAHAE